MRVVPLWFVLLALIACGLFTVAFGWVVKDSLTGKQRTGEVGNVAVAVANFPTMVFQTVKELKGFTSGGYKDEWLSVARETRADYTGFAEIGRADSIDLQGLMIRGGTEAVSGWRYISGAFQLGGSAENAILLMSPDLRIVRYWILDEVPTDGIEPRAKYRKLVHGFEVLPDGLFDRYL